ncbi:MAG: hypothetical protein PUG10_12510 [Lachnospiraceae bacterium]|nr:hypothetical protein [Lachnospiraceae bacterium]
MLRVGIVDNNNEYVMNLMKYINEHFFDLKLIMFSGIDKARNYYENNSLDGLIVDEENYELDFINENQVAFFCEEKLTGEHNIFRYQNMDVIHNKIVDMFLIDGCLCDEDYIIAVYSPIGRSGKTKYAIDICNKSEKGIYIGWEDYSGMVSGSEHDKRIFNEFMYYLTEKNIKLFDVLDNAKANQNGKYIRSTCIENDVKCIDASMIKWLSKELKQEGRFKLCFDVGIGAIDDLKILSCMDKVYVPYLDDELSKRKITQFRNRLKNMNINFDNFLLVDTDNNLTRL